MRRPPVALARIAKKSSQEVCTLRPCSNSTSVTLRVRTRAKPIGADGTEAPPGSAPQGDTKSEVSMGTSEKGAAKAQPNGVASDPIVSRGTAPDIGPLAK